MRLRLVMIVVLASFYCFLPAQILGSRAIAETTDSARVFAVNLWSAPVDIQLGDQPIFSVAALGPSMPSTMQVIPSCTATTLYYKPSADTKWRAFLDSQGQIFSFSFQTHTIYMVRFGANGVLTVLEMARTAPGQAHISVINNCGLSLDEVSLLPGTTQPALQVQHLPDQAFTEFADVPTGRYGGVWKLGDTREFIQGTDATSLGLVNLQNDGWYCLIVAAKPDGTGADNRRGLIWDISPNAAN